MSQHDSPDSAGVLREVIWRRPERAGKGPAPSLTRAQVAAAAVRLADAEGIDVVSMRTLGAALGVGAASLYRYVDGKTELLDLMADLVEGEDGAPPDPSGHWRADLMAFASRTRALFLRHPWLTGVAAARPAFGPNSLMWVEHGLAALDPLHLDDDERLVVSEILNSFIRGFVARELADQQALLTTGTDADSWARAIAPYMNDIIHAGRHPRFSAIVLNAQLPHQPTRLVLFEAALGRILDGLAAA